MSDDDLIRRGDALAFVRDPQARNDIAALPARGVGVPESVIHRTVLDWIRDDAGVAVKMSVTPDQANALTARILAALAPTDAAHVNETPKSEHDGTDVLTAAQAREAALREAAAEVQRWFHDGRDNRDPAALILALIGEERT